MEESEFLKMRKEIKQKLNLLKEKLIEIMNLKNKININLMNYMLLLFK